MWRHDAGFQSLRSIPLFEGSSTKELAEIDTLATEDHAESGEVLIREGRPGRETFIILEGEAIVTVGARLIARLGPGDFFGEMALLGRRKVRTATVTSITPMRMLVLDPRQLSALLQIDRVARSMLKEVVDRFSGPAVARRPA